jgi:hypothetical protein
MFAVYKARRHYPFANWSKSFGRVKNLFINFFLVLTGAMQVK